MPLYKIDPGVEEDQIEYMRAQLELNGWKPTDRDEWDFFWSDELHPLEVFASLADGQKVNHFPGIGSIVFKDTLHDFLAVAAQRFGELSAGPLYDFFPKVFSMPEQYEEFLDVAASDPRRLWLLKPKALSCGRGIRLLREPRKAPKGEKWMVQEYVADPLLLSGLPFKHVLRFYLLITSLEPLVLHLFPNGVVTFTSRPYSLSGDALDDRVVHVTNGRIQRLNTSVGEPVRMWDFDTYGARLREDGLDETRLWERIRRMLVLTVIAHREPILSLSLERTDRLDCCFELLGCDVLIDSTLRPWLLECNMSPGLDYDFRIEDPRQNPRRRAIESMVADMLRISGLTAAQEELSPTENRKRRDTEATTRRNFELIFPASDARDFLPCFERLRPGDLAQLESSTASAGLSRDKPSG